MSTVRSITINTPARNRSDDRVIGVFIICDQFRVILIITRGFNWGKTKVIQVLESYFAKFLVRASTEGFVGD